jgi:hypothetical protein
MFDREFLQHFSNCWRLSVDSKERHRSPIHLALSCCENSHPDGHFHEYLVLEAHEVSGE